MLASFSQGGTPETADGMEMEAPWPLEPPAHFSQLLSFSGEKFDRQTALD